MNSYAVIAAFVVLAVAFAAADEKNQQQQMVGSAYGGQPSSSYGAPAPAPSYSAPAPGPSYSAPAPGPSYGVPAPVAAPSYGSSGGSSYGPVSIPAPPCPKNYIVSCQPSLTAAPCSPQSHGSSYGGGSAYGSVGAYSESYPVYAYAAPVPPYGYY